MTITPAPVSALGAATLPARAGAKPAPLAHGGVLDGLRFMAAFCMVIYHFSYASPVPLAKIHPLFARGYLATDFFLIVSGYVLGRIYGRRVAASDISAWQFFLRRVQRVAPAHLIMIGAFVALMGATALVGIKPQHPEYLAWSDLPSQLFLLQAYGAPGGFGWNAPSWSLSALLGCYLIFPMVWRWQLRIASPMLVASLSFVVLMAADQASQFWLNTPIYEFPRNFGIGRALPLFLCGAALARLSTELYIPPRIAIAMSAICAVLLCAVQFLGQLDLISVLLIAGLVVGAGAVPVKHPSAVLSRAAVISFALFITNEFVRFVYSGALHVLTHDRTLPIAAGWLVWWSAVAAAVLFAVAFHYLVDMPTQRLIRRFRR